jgi:hypothetical protein
MRLEGGVAVMPLFGQPHIAESIRNRMLNPAKDAALKPDQNISGLDRPRSSERGFAIAQPVTLLAMDSRTKMRLIRMFATKKKFKNRRLTARQRGNIGRRLSRDARLPRSPCIYCLAGLHSV